VVVTPIDIVDRNQTAVIPVERATPGTAADFTDILVCFPHVIATDTAVITLYKDAATASLVAPAVPTEGGATRRTGVISKRTEVEGREKKGYYSLARVKGVISTV
jgi:hypothetical protein